MDFSITDDQRAARDLARDILKSTVTTDSLHALRQSEHHYHQPAWEQLAKAGLLCVHLPEAHGGAGLGLIGATLILEEIGRAAAPLPYLASAVLGAMPVSAFGSEQQRARLLPGMIEGTTILTAALAELGTPPSDPRTRAVDTADGWMLTGRKDFVIAGMDADAMMVSARTDTGPALFMVDGAHPGLLRARQDTAHGVPEARIEFHDTPAELLTCAPDALDWTLQHAHAALCALGAGVFDAEVRLTATYTATRTQFDRPIATFQAVAQRAADAYIDAMAIQLTAQQAAWRLDAGLPAAAEVAAARIWLCEAGQRVAAAAQHLHGGIGMDRGYPLHRYYMWAKWLQLALGGAPQHLITLGALLADA